MSLSASRAVCSLVFALVLLVCLAGPVSSHPLNWWHGLTGSHNACIYRYSCDGRYVYVGKATTCRDRLTDHSAVFPNAVALATKFSTESDVGAAGGFYDGMPLSANGDRFVHEFCIIQQCIAAMQARVPHWDAAAQQHLNTYNNARNFLINVAGIPVFAIPGIAVVALQPGDDVTVAAVVADTLVNQQQFWATHTDLGVRARATHAARQLMNNAEAARLRELRRGLANIMRIEFVEVPANELPSAENTMIRYAGTHGNPNTCNRDNNQGTNYQTTLPYLTTNAGALTAIDGLINTGQQASITQQQWALWYQRRYYAYWHTAAWTSLTDLGDTRDFTPAPLSYFTQPAVCISSGRLNTLKTAELLSQAQAGTINTLQQQLQAALQQVQLLEQRARAPATVVNMQLRQIPLRDKFLRLKDRLMKEMDNPTGDATTVQAQAEESASDESTAEETA